MRRHNRRSARVTLVLPGLALALAVVGLTGCSRARASSAEAAAPPAIVQPHWGTLNRTVRVVGTIVPVHSVSLHVPQLTQQFEQLTLSYIAPSGIPVKKGQLVAAFDRTQLQDAAADAQAQFHSLSSQVQQLQAKNAADAAQRAVDLSKALADQGHASLELSKGPVLSALQAATEKVNLADATAHVKSLRSSDTWLTKEAAAKLQALDLQRDEQKQVWQQAEADSQRMVLRAPMDGMLAVALPPGYGKPVPGMTLYSGTPLLQIFDPGQMLVEAQVSEVDLAWIPPGAHAQVRIDAYPGLVLPAHLLRLNPVAVSLLGTSIHNFGATFALDGHDPRALPDLNVSLQIASPPRSGWLVPRGDVTYQNGNAYVEVSGAGGHPQPRPVQVLVFAGPWIEIGAPWLGLDPKASVHGARARQP